MSSTPMRPSSDLRIPFMLMMILQKCKPTIKKECVPQFTKAWKEGKKVFYRDGQVFLDEQQIN